MNSLTRRVASLRLNSPESYRVFTSITSNTRIPSRHHHTALTLSLQGHLSPSRLIRSSSFESNSNSRSKSDPIFPAMDQNPPESNEDFVHIENPNPDNVEPLSESVVSVAGEPSEETETVSEETSKVLPEELARSVLVLTCESSAEGGTSDVYLVGTAHVSQESCQEVQAVIEFLKPEVVFLELCSSRVAVLSPQNLKVPTMAEMIDMWKKNQNTFGILYSWFLAKVASKLEVFPGAEFRVAYEEATKYGGKVILGDRPIQVTLRRTWGMMPLWHKTKLLYSLLFQALFLPSPADLNRMLKEMDDVDMLTLVIQETSKQFPTLMDTLLHERDQYMSSTLLRVASEHRSVVAVVGKGHLQGIKKYWKQPISTKELMKMPSQKPAVSATKILTTLGAAVAGVAIISGIYLKCKK